MQVPLSRPPWPQLWPGGEPLYLPGPGNALGSLQSLAHYTVGRREAPGGVPQALRFLHTLCLIFTVDGTNPGI